MALARKCDRCGKLHSVYSNECFGLKKANAVAVARISDNGQTVMDKNWYDLCPDCLKELDAFMRME